MNYGCVKNIYNYFFTQNERKIFLNLQLVFGLTLSQGSRILSKELKIPESTVKYILRKFRDAKIISAGDYQNQCRPVELTYLGKILAGGDNNE